MIGAVGTLVIYIFSFYNTKHAELVAESSTGTLFTCSAISLEVQFTYQV